jgi:hypothetical protein
VFFIETGGNAMSYRANVTDRQQDILEAAAFENGVPVHEDHVVRVIAEGNDGGAQKTNHSAVANHIGDNAGVVMPDKDTPGRFVENLQGKH